MKQIRLLMSMAVFPLAGSLTMPALGQNIAVRPDGRADLVWFDQFGNLLYYWAIPGAAWQSTSVDNLGGNAPGTGGQRGLGAAIAVRPGGVWLNSEGEADIAAVDVSGGLHYYHSGDVPLCLLGGSSSTCGLDAPVSWSPSSFSWVAAGRVAFSAPAVAVRPNGEADIVVQGPNNSLMHYHAFPGTTWVPDQIAGSDTTYLAYPGSGTPAIAVLPTGEIAVAALGRDNSLLFYESTTPPASASDPNPVSSWSAPKTIAPQGTMAPPPESGFVLSGQYMAARSTGEVDVVGMGAGGSLFYFSSTPPYSNWTKTTIPGPGTTISNPVITVRSVDPAGEADVVATSDDALWYYHLEPGATSWSIYPPLPVTGLVMGVVARSSGPEGEVDVLATDNANLTLRYLWWSGAYNICGLPAWYAATPANFCDWYDYFGACK